MRQDKKKIKRWRNTTKKRVKEDTKEAEKNLDGHSEKEQEIIKENLKTLGEGL